MDDYQKTQLNNIINDLELVVSGLDDISNKIREEFIGIDSYVCADAINKENSVYKRLLEELREYRRNTD